MSREGTTVFLTTHYMEEADELCDRVAFLSQGRIVAKALLGLTFVALEVPVLLGLTGLVPADPTLFAGALLLLSAAMVGMGLLLGALVRTVGQLNQWGSLLLLGVLVPSAALTADVPPAAQLAISLLPSGAALRLAINGLVGGPFFADAWLSVGALAGWAALAYGFLLLRLRRREA